MHTWITPQGNHIKARYFIGLILKYLWQKITTKGFNNDTKTKK